MRIRDLSSDVCSSDLICLWLIMLCPKSRKKRERLPMGSNEKPKLLVVEDDEGLQRQLRWSYEDYEVVAAKDRATAIDMLRAEEPDVDRKSTRLNSSH